MLDCDWVARVARAAADVGLEVDDLWTNGVWWSGPADLESAMLVLRDFDSARPERMEPVPLKRLDGDVVMTDGHTRAFAAFLCGMEQVPTVWDEDELDWEAYRVCVAWCKDDGIRSVSDLVGRVVGREGHQELWLARCRRMHEELAEKRASGGG
jgi:hypothetical protein